jgi:hypothetical protein
VQAYRAGLPPGGAGITVVPAEALHYDKIPRTLDDWIEIQTRHKRVTARREFVLNGPNGNLSVVEISSKCCAVPPFQEGVSR